jgi:glucose/arabinose dehydrogenase
MSSSGCNTLSSTIAEAWLQPNFCAATYTSGLIEPRGLHITNDDGSNEELLLVEKGMSRIVRLDNNNAAGRTSSSIVPVTPVIVGGLSHGIEVSNNGYIYTSTPTTVYRIPYITGQTTPSSVESIEEVIVGMDRYASGELGAPDGHTSRTLAFDNAKVWLYVSIGSEGNVDTDSHRARIRRFNIALWEEEEEDYSSSSNSSLNNSTMLLPRRMPMEFTNGEVFADGLRNEVGLAFNSFGVLWGVENGADNLYRNDLGGDVHNDNPAEELNRFLEEDAGKHYGYPYCWSEYCLSPSVSGMGIKGAGTIWAWPDFLNTMVTGPNGTVITDEWCRMNTIPSIVAMPSHSAPLGITFYNWTDMSQTPECSGGFPKSMNKYAFIAFHGSWNRDPPTGYKVVFVPFDTNGNPSGQQPIDLFRHDGDNAEWSSGSRPVDLQFDQCGRLYVTDDGVGSVIRITYAGQYTDEYVPIDTDVADGPSCSSSMPVPPPTPMISQGSSTPSSSEILVSSVPEEVLTSPPSITLPELLDPPISSVGSSFTLRSIIISLCFHSAIQLINVIRLEIM